jgi:hypothetical protein
VTYYQSPPTNLHGRAAARAHNVHLKNLTLWNTLSNAGRRAAEKQAITWFNKLTHTRPAALEHTLTAPLARDVRRRLLQMTSVEMWGVDTDD